MLKVAENVDSTSNFLVSLPHIQTTHHQSACLSVGDILHHYTPTRTLWSTNQFSLMCPVSPLKLVKDR